DKDPSFAVEVKSPGIATAFCKQFELFRCRMIAPDSLPQKFDASDVARGSAALHAVKPTVRPPVQTVGYGVCIFKAETGKAHFGIPVRPVIFVVVRIEQEVRRVQHESPTAPDRHARGDVQPSEEVFVRLEPAVSVSVFEDCNLVGATHMIRRWLRNL